MNDSMQRYAFNEQYMLALTIWKEARNQPIKGQTLVADTILNRVADPRWPNTIKGVALQPWQFSVFNEKDPNRALQPEFSSEADWKAWNTALHVAFTSYLMGPKSKVNHYHTKNILPYWAVQATPSVTVKDHIFYAL